MGKHQIKKPFYFIDLFAGCGGISLGVESAGFEGLGHIEIDPFARKTLELNFGLSSLKSISESEGDVTRVNLQNLRKELLSLGCGTLELLVACPPCQGFSAVGRAKINSLTLGKKCFSQDPRNKLYETIIEYVRKLKPKALLFENVPGMLNVRGENVVEKFCSEIERAGYEVRCSLLNSAWYGVPQSRERVFVVAFRKDLEIVPRFPEIRHDLTRVGGAWGQPIKNGIRWEKEHFFVNHECIVSIRSRKFGTSVGDALRDLPPFYEHLKKGYRVAREKYPVVSYLYQNPPNEYCDLMRNWKGFRVNVITDHFCRSTPRDYPIFAKMKQGDLFPQAHSIAVQRWNRLKKMKKENRLQKLPPKNKIVPPYRLDSFPEKWQKLESDKLSCTLTAHLEKDGYSHIHFDDKQARTLTIREAARLQSFPDGYQFFGPMGRVFKQIGNAVPPMMALEVAKTIYAQLNSMEKNTKISVFRDDKKPPFLSQS